MKRRFDFNRNFTLKFYVHVTICISVLITGIWNKWFGPENLKCTFANYRNPFVALELRLKPQKCIELTQQNHNQCLTMVHVKQNVCQMIAD